MTDGERILRAGSRSFALAARLLPRRVRAEVAALYAYLRHVDDAVDLAPPDAQPARVAHLERELDALYAGAPHGDAVLAAFQQVVRAHRIPRLYPRELLAGMRMDAAQHEYATTEELLRYAYRVAGTVGLMLCHVFGLRDERVLANAAHLGIAMQLTNVCRDVAEDLARGRLYLPRALLGEPLATAVAARRGGTLTPELAARLAPTLDHLLRCADHYYASGDAGMHALGLRTATAVRAARYVYAAIGTELRRRRLDPLAGRAVVPATTKAALVARALRESASELPRRLRRVHPCRITGTRRFEDVVLA